MRYLRLRNLVSLLVMLVVPAVSFAVVYQPNSEREADRLLNRIHTDASHAKRDAGRLEQLNTEPFIAGWQGQAMILTQEKHWDNKMDRTLFRLENMEGMLPADQQAEINSLRAPAAELTTTTQATIHFLNHHHDQIYEPRYRGLVNDMFNEADRVGAITTTAPVMEANYMANPTPTYQTR